MTVCVDHVWRLDFRVRDYALGYFVFATPVSDAQDHGSGNLTNSVYPATQERKMRTRNHIGDQTLLD
ncbi:hypothetical protein PROAA_1030019 [Candidatus Propionivibrio aalborgensis]|uniref:Uncharacterized protein n=1 Tax=Candidatus Propionivibrio aalborgensis TaxID=1860101 RepID=A0A1A8XHC2_9RHOO|nr:hypothetical protein PROAA_1030019 [Candidatus Propionivibrio aalborgensis]